MTTGSVEHPLVVKCGGAHGINLETICRDVANLVHEGASIILVHGGSEQATVLAEALGHPPRYLTSPTGIRSRYTDAATLDIVTMAMAGRINTGLVACLQALDVQAIGLSGVDGRLVRAARKEAIKAVAGGETHIVRDDLTGKIVSVNADLLKLLVDRGYVPVLSPPALDPWSGPVNVDADRMAAAVAVAVGASRLIILSNVPGLLRDPADPTSLVTSLSLGEIGDCMSLAEGRMKLKLIAAAEALKGGVGRVTLGDGHGEFPLRSALAGRGTLIDRDAGGATGGRLR